MGSAEGDGGWCGSGKACGRSGLLGPQADRWESRCGGRIVGRRRGERLRSGIEDEFKGQTWTAGEAAVEAAAGILTGAVGFATEEAVGETAQRGADMSGNRMADAATILVEIGVPRVMDPRFDTPVAAAEAQHVGGSGAVGVAATHQMEEAFFRVTVAEVEPVPPDGHKLGGEGESEGFSADRLALDFPCFNPAA